MKFKFFVGFSILFIWAVVVYAGTIGSYSADTSPDLTDVLVMEQSDASATNKVTVGNLLAAGNDLDSSGDVADDSHNHVFGNIDAFTEANLYTLLSDVSQFYEAGDEDTIAAAISEGALTDASIVEADLKAVDAAVDEDILTYESTTGDFEWHTAAELGIGTATSITDDLIVEADLNMDVAPADGDFLQYDSTGANFTWRSGAETLSDIGAEGTLTNSTGLRDALADETGSGSAVFATSPTLVTPILGAATATTLDTGQGAYELWAMNQDVETTDDVTFNSVTTAASDDGYTYYDPATASESDWYIGPNHDSVGDDNDSLEFRQSATPGTSVEMELEPDGDLIVTGTISGLVSVTLDTDAAVDLSTSANAKGSMRINNDNDPIDYTLPPAVAGLNVCFYSRYAAVVTVDVDDGVDVIILNGTALTAGYAIDSPGTAGDFICLMAIDSTYWMTLGRSGTWVDGGAD